MRHSWQEVAVSATLTTFFVTAADEGTPAATGVNWENIALIGGMMVAVATALIALYRARPQRALDKATKEKIDEEVKRLQADHDRRRTKRLLRLESYIDKDVAYHRDVAALFLQLKQDGLLPANSKIPIAPVLPQVDDDEEE